MTVQDSAIQVLRQICTDCRTTPTNYQVNECQFEARHLTRMESVEARYGLMETSDTIGKGLFTVMEGGIDGMEWTYRDYRVGKPQSRATGGLGKMDCGIDPQPFETRVKKKRLITEKLYIHREMCSLQFIGTIFNSPSQSTGVPVYIQANSTLQAAARSQDFFIDLMMWDFHAMALAIDGNNILGDYTGDNRGSIVKADATGGFGLSEYPNWDGVFKQASQQSAAVYYHMVTIELPAIVTDSCLFINWNGNWDSAATHADLAAQINEYCVNTTGRFPFSATLDGTTLTLVANYPEEKVYGDIGGLKIFFSETGTLEDCAEGLEATELQCPMQWHESPLKFDYNEELTCDNFYDYFLPKIKAIKKHCAVLDNTGMGMDLGFNYIAIDPLLLIDKEINEIKRICACENGQSQTDAIGRILPEFCGVQALKGTGLWYWSYSRNLIFLTNTTSDILGNTEMGYDPKCQDVWMRNEMLANAMVLDFNKFASNVCGSHFEDKLHAPFVPENLPHYNGELRSDANVNCACVPSGSVDTFAPHACVVVNCGDDPAVDDCTLELDSDAIAPTGDTIASYEWTVYFQNAAPQQPATQSESVSVVVPNADCELITYVSLVITLGSGTTETVIIPNPKFIKNC